MHGSPAVNGGGDPDTAMGKGRGRKGGGGGKKGRSKNSTPLLAEEVPPPPPVPLPRLHEASLPSSPGSARGPDLAWLAAEPPPRVPGE